MYCYFEHFHVFLSAVSGCVSISAFAWLVSVPVGIASSAGGLKVFAITAGLKSVSQLSRESIAW